MPLPVAEVIKTYSHWKELVAANDSQKPANDEALYKQIGLYDPGLSVDTLQLVATAMVNTVKKRQDGQEENTSPLPMVSVNKRTLTNNGNGRVSYTDSLIFSGLLLGQEPSTVQIDRPAATSFELPVLSISALITKLGNDKQQLMEYRGFAIDAKFILPMANDIAQETSQTRFAPWLREGKNPFLLDGKTPAWYRQSKLHLGIIKDENDEPKTIMDPYTRRKLAIQLVRYANICDIKLTDRYSFSKKSRR